MAAASHVYSEDQFLCSICQRVFTEPVTTSCGHNFCKSCITEHWDNNENYQCPLCKKTFNPRPELQVNIFISQMLVQFRHEAQNEPGIYSSDQQAAKPGDVPCDICTETKLKALKSCLVCLTSYCQTHLEPHLTVSGLKRHQLINPVKNLEDRMCGKHDKPLELFCSTDHTCICLICPVLDHKNHEFVTLKEEYEKQKVELKKTEAEIQKMIQERQLKIQEIQHSVELSKKAADRETAEGLEVFTTLMELVQRSLDQFIQEIQQKQRTTEKQAEDFIKELEEEICELKNRSTEVEQLSGSEDHLHFVQRLTSVKAAPSMKTWTKVSVRPPSYEGTVVRAVTKLENTVIEHMKKPIKNELERIQQYMVDVTLDPDTAHPKLRLSDNGKKVSHVNQKSNLPDYPQRFSDNPCVLGEQSFCSGRFYFEVQVKEKSKWTIGVVRESINRKAYTAPRPQDGYWTIWLRNENQYKALAGPDVSLSLKYKPEKIGVFVSYDEGLVSFYDVDDDALIYAFNGCCFNDKLLPFLSPCNNDGGENSAPLIINPDDSDSSDSENSDFDYDWQ